MVSVKLNSQQWEILLDVLYRVDLAELPKKDKTEQDRRDGLRVIRRAIHKELAESEDAQ